MKRLYHFTYMTALLLVMFFLAQTAVAQQACVEVDQGVCLDAQSASKKTPQIFNPQAFGDVVDSFTSFVPDGLPVGLEDDGSGDLLTTDIDNATDDLVFTQNTSGTLVDGPFTATNRNAIGVTTDGSLVYITDTINDEVAIFQTDGTFVDDFSVVAQTTFPEGITFNPNTGHLYVVNGSGGNAVHEYMTDGTFVNSFPINGSSQDGIAYDPQTDSYWIYDSGTDTVRQYDTSFNQITSFPGTIANSFSGGEGVAVIGTRLYVMATSDDTVVVFDISTLDVSVEKTTSDDNPQLGDEVTFTITVSATGVDSDSANNIEVEDILPSELDYVSSSATQGAYDPNTSIWTVGSLLSDQSATLTITTEVTDTNPGPISNTATATFDEQPDINPDNDSDTVVLTIQSADLSLDKDVACGMYSKASSPPCEFNLGQTITYVLDVCHEEGVPAVGIRVTDILPDGVSFVSASGDYDPVSGVYQFGDLEEGDCTTETITVTLETTEEVTNRADISFSSAPDPFEGNNSDAVTVNGQAADLELEKRVASFTEVDGIFYASFVVTVTNDGPSDADYIYVSDMLSPEATITDVTVSQGSAATFGGNFTEWELGYLDVGESATLTMDVWADADDLDVIQNVAEVVDSDRPDPDSEPGDGQGDDHDAAAAGVRSNPDFVRGLGPGGIIDRGGRRFSADLSLTKTVDNSSPASGSDVVYTITVMSDGPQPTSGVEVTDVLPAGVTFVSSTASQGSYDESTGLWEVGSLAAGSSATLEITATVTGTGTITNTAAVTDSNLPDPDDFFNFFDETPEVDDEASASLTVQGAASKVSGTDRVSLGSGYPNPFNPEAVIPFALPATSEVRLAVYDMLGREVALLVDGQVSAGTHEVVFNGSRLATGVYLVRLEAAGVVQTQRITLMK